MNTIGKIPWAAVSAILTTLLVAPAYAEGVPAGTMIENVAQATYEADGQTRTISSNVSELKVDELLDVTVVSLDSGAVQANGGTAVLAYSVTNTGNGPEAYLLTTDPAVASNDFVPVVASIAVDTNNNGTYDPGVDQILTAPQQTTALAPDASLTVFVIANVDNSVPDGSMAQVKLLAAAVTGTGVPGTVFAGAGENGGNAVVGANGADGDALGKIIVGKTVVELVKSAAVVDPFGGTTTVSGSIVTYTIQANVTGAAPINNLVVSDPFPAGTTYLPGTLKLDGAALTDASDADAGEATATAILVNIGTVAGTGPGTGAAPTTYSISFDVSVD